MSAAVMPTQLDVGEIFHQVSFLGRIGFLVSGLSFSCM